VGLTMRATRKAGEVPCAAYHGGTYDAVAAGQSHVSSNGWVHTITALTLEWPETGSKVNDRPTFFLFREGGYAYLNGPPVPHE